MTLAPGTVLGPYEIVSQLGAGGMGEVYRAKDRRLDRSVAIKVLPSHLSTDPDLRIRFEREARAISRVSHPNICALYDVGVHEGTDYLVMELLEGETLADRLRHGPLSQELTLRFALQIADALERAHSAGITHRDLKPGNIMLTPAGVKILDFGLAKVAAGARASSDLTAAPTAPRALTAEGSLLGTLPYMAPEQVQGKEVDARTDIFALGSILYEMVTGRRAFDAPSQASLIGAILHTQPPRLGELVPVTPPILERIIITCLEKDPRERWQSAHDLAVPLRWLAGGGDLVPAKGQEPYPRRKLIVAGLIAAAAGLIAGALLSGYLIPRSAPNVGQRRHVALNLDDPLPVSVNGFGAPFQLSPDGSRLVYIAVKNGQPMLHMRSLESGVVSLLEGTQGADGPFFSPDGASIAFFSEGSLKRVGTNGGAPKILCPGGVGSGGTWAEDGTIVFCPIPGGTLSMVSAEGGAPREVTRLASGEAGHAWPMFLPNRRTFLYSVEREGKPWDEAQILAHDLETGKTWLVVDGGTKPHLVGNGTLVFARGSKVMSAEFDPKTLKTTTEPRQILAGAASQPGTGGAFMAVSRNGSIAYLPGDASYFTSRLTWRDRTGRSEVIDVPPRPYVNPRISPDGQQIAVQIIGANDDIWILNIHRKTFSRLTSSSENMFPIWSPDGRSLAISMIDGGKPPTIFIHDVVGAASRELKYTSRPQFASSWSPDGKLAFVEFGGPTGNDVSVLSSSGGGEITKFARNRFNESAADFSPDSAWLVYASDESGESQVYVRAVTGVGERYQISTTGGTEPRWSPAGNEIFYRRGIATMHVPIDAAGGMRIGNPQELFRARLEENPLVRNYDVTTRGDRFLGVEPTRPEEVRSLTLLMNVVPVR